MIKKPKVGQTVYFLGEDSAVESAEVSNAFTTHVYIRSPNRWMDNKNIFLNEQSALQHALNNYNKEINKLSKKREKLASRLAKILKK